MEAIGPTGEVVSVTEVDPRRILAKIAADVRQPAAARVAACRVLISSAPKTVDDPDELDPITKRALQLLNAPTSRLN
jgi:hypothetical protein